MVTDIVKRFISIWVVIVAMYGCQSTPGVPVWQTPVDSSLEPSPEALLWQARSAPYAEAFDLYLRATHGFIREESWEAAELALAEVDPELLEADLGSAYQLAAAELAMHRGEFLLAERLLAEVVNALEPTRDAQSKYRPFLALAKLCAAEGNFVCAANRLMDVLPPETEQQAVHDLIWSYMNHAPGLSARSQQQLQTGTRLGWWELKSAMLESFSGADQRARLTHWRNRWSAHPAFELLPTSLLPLNDESWQPQHIGLLLPLRGPLARAGRAVRDGFIAAYLQRSSLTTISIYDTDSSPLPVLYEQMLLDGVELIVGPLSKTSLKQINGLNPELPVLGLNYLDKLDQPAQNLLQLGLAIEDEADTLINRLLEDGIDRIIVFHNRTDWSLRAVERLKSQWPFSLTTQEFDDIKTITESVGRAMQVDASSSRHASLSRLLNVELEFLPRARDDVDAIVALISNLEATAMAPALKFHFAGNLPVYASSQSVRGSRSDALEELNGFRVSELPWQLFDDPLFDAMAEVFALPNNSLATLYALGIDAFRVSDRLPAFTRSADAHLLGSTGILTLGQDRRFHRELAWGVVIRGELIALPLLAERE